LIGLNSAGRIVTRVAPAGGNFHPGDVSAAAEGVFVSDSQNGAIYELAKTGYSLSPLVKAGVGKSGQGTAIDAEGKRLIVADYSQGVGAVDLSSGARTLLPRQDGKPLRGIDGLVRCGQVYYGIYNGTTPGALVSFTVVESGITAEMLMKLPDPTQLVYDGKRLLIVADSGWATLDKPDFTRIAGAPIIAVPLSEDCKPQ